MPKNKKKYIPHKSKSPKEQNAFLKYQKTVTQVKADANRQTFEQYTWDLLCIVLNDPEVMGKDTFGIDRILKIWTAWGKEYEKWFDVLLLNDRTDAMRLGLDDRLQKIQKDVFIPFHERYSWLPMTKEEKSLQ